MKESDVLALLPTVARIARRLRTSHHPVLDQHDLEQEGILGLLRAVLAYDPAHGVPLATYAEWRILGSILDAYRAFDPVSRHARRGGDTSSPVILSLDQPISPTHAPARHKAWRQHGTKYATVHGTTEPLDVSAERLQLRAAVERACKTLSLQMRLVLHYFHAEELGMEEIGKRLGVSASRVSQLHTAALATLRPKLTQWDDGTPKPRTRTNTGYRMPRKTKGHTDGNN